MAVTSVIRADFRAVVTPGWFRAMIRLSRYLTISALACWILAGCDGQSCTTRACNEGLTISFAGLSSATTYQIVVSNVTNTPESIPIATCTLAPDANGTPELSCNSSEVHTDVGSYLRIEDSTFQEIQVDISADGETVLQQSYPVTYQSTEINGPGCGVCTQASITVTAS